MSKLSISRAWDETKAVFRRDGNLIAIVALALLVVPGTLNALVQPQQPVQPGQVVAPGWWTLVSLVALLIGIVGQLAIVRVGLGERQTIGEAIGHGLRRAPAFLGATILWVLPFALLFVPLAQRMQQDPQNAPPGLVLAALVLLLAMLFFVVRLVLTTVVAAAEPLGPVGLLKRSWALSSGVFLRLFGALLMFAVAASILLLATELITGIITRLVFGTIEPMSVGALVVALITQVAGAAVTCVLIILLTRIYLQRAGAASEPASVPDAP